MVGLAIPFGKDDEKIFVGSDPNKLKQDGTATVCGKIPCSCRFVRVLHASAALRKTKPLANQRLLIMKPSNDHRPVAIYY